MGSKKSPSTRAKAKTAAKRTSATKTDQGKSNSQTLSTINEGDEQQPIFPIEDFTAGLSDKDNSLDKFDQWSEDKAGEIDSETDDRPGAKGSSAKAKSVDTTAHKDIVMYVPQGYHEGYQRVTISKMSDWSAALRAIHRNIGCENIPKKPLLQWKFEKPRAKAFTLKSQADWEDLVIEVEADLKKKNPSKVDVLVDEAYLLSLRARLSGKEPPMKKGKSKVPLLNLDASSDTEVTGLTATNPVNTLLIDNQGQAESACYEKLVKKLTSCGNCPHNAGSYCLKTVNDAHVRFTAQQLKAWAKAWASEIGMGICEDQPPKTPLFGHFFSAPANSKVDPPNMSNPAIPNLSPPLPNTSTHLGGVPTLSPDVNTLLMTQIMGMAQIQTHWMRDAFGTPRSSRRVPTSPNPSGQGITSKWTAISDDKEYPRFDEFFESLGDKRIDRDLGSILAKLADAKIYRINELTWFDDTELLKVVGLAPGDIKWLHIEVNKELNRIANY